MSNLAVSPKAASRNESESANPRSTIMDRSVFKAMRKYIGSDMFRIPGYMHPVDALCFAAVLSYQRIHGLSGSVAEVGVFFGRSFFLMAQSLKPGEKAFAADLFEAGAQVDGESLQIRRFRETASRLGIEIDPACLVAGPSQALRSSDILAAIGRVRFFSIDGGHAIEQVQADATLASEVIAEHGMLVFDDFGNPEWPEVSLAVFDFLRDKSGAYVPVAITKSKLYVCRNELHSTYSAALVNSAWMRGFAARETSMLGSRLLWFHHPIGERIAFEALVKVGLGRLALALQARR